MRLIFLRIYSLFQQKIYIKKTPDRGKSAETTKNSSNFEKNPEYYSQINFRKSHHVS